MKSKLAIFLAWAAIAHATMAAEVSLDPNPLEAVVAQLLAEYEKSGAQEKLPALIYPPGTQDLPVEAPLRLGDVRPVDALALIAAAAGCTLEPIYSPEQDGDDHQRIIGYRFEPEGFKAGDAGGGFGGGSDDTASGASQGGNQQSLRQNSTAEAESTAAATVKVVDPNTSSVPNGFAPRPLPLVAAPAAHLPAVRIYALGSLLGTELDGALKQKALEQLVFRALEFTDEKGLDNLRISFHRESGAMIVKATAGQHEVVQQALLALKEHDATATSIQK